MNLHDRRSVVPALLACLLLVFAGPAEAQQRRILQIHDGEVRVDDKVVPPGELPATLDVQNVDLTLSFSGIDDPPVVRIGKHYYVVGSDRLEEETVERYGPVSADANVGVSEDGGWYRVELTDAMTKTQMQALESRAAKIQEMSNDLQRHRGPEVTRLSQEMERTAQMAAEVAAELPKVQIASYWYQVQATDSDLYEQLVREWQLESEIHETALRIRHLSATEGETGALVKDLRSRLEAAFKLKQANRGREIQQLEHQLESLDEEMKRRQEARDAIIDRRLKELIGQP